LRHDQSLRLLKLYGAEFFEAGAEHVDGFHVRQVSELVRNDALVLRFSQRFEQGFV
jgi:hypothetical protein